MGINAWLRVGVIAFTAFSLSACSYIASLFPDKQKQYRYSGELPDLELPPDLHPVDSEGKEGRTKHRFQVADEKSDSASKAKSAPTEPRRGSRKPAKHDSSTATLAATDDNAPLIEIEETHAEAWNDVNRALGRLQIEVIDQNRSDGIYYVYFGGERPKKEEGLWNYLTSWARSEKDKAKEFRIKLEEKGDSTRIRVFDQEDHPVAEGLGLDLLKRLHEKLQHLSEPEPEEGKHPPEPEEGKHPPEPEEGKHPPEPEKK
ncbi:MAG: outer membrane protein assembly factor BamC [Methylococcaceae bacterium]|nr:outer membrane protein assembly factor BamC [Methylococcaceae bacterium]